jgi:3-hydroxybutyryl-CoA dehydrogenase
MGNQIKSVGIIGAGQMGGGIAHVCAMAGYDVYVHDISADTLQEMLATISGNLARQVASGKTTETEREAALARINFAPDMSGLAAMDLVIEAATEDETVKRKIYQQLCPQLKPEAILATNTSSISITRLACHRPARALHRHPLHEPGAGDETGRAGARHRHRRRDVQGGARIRFIESLGKTITVEDFPPSSSTASCCR